MRAYLDQQQAKQIEDHATNLRDRLLIRLLRCLGCRVSEALGLEVKDIDFDQGTVTIQHLKSRVKLVCHECGARLGKSHSFCPKCGSMVVEAIEKAQEHRRMRTLPLDENTLQMMKEYLSRGGAVERDGKNLVFGIARGQAWRVIKECAERAGLGKLVNPESGKAHNISPHKLRDAFAVHAMKLDDSGDGLRLLQEHLGHASFNTTAKYRKISGKEHQEWYQRLWQKGQDNGGSPEA